MLCLFVHLKNTVRLDVLHIQIRIEAYFHFFHILYFLDDGAHFLQILARFHKILNALLLFCYCGHDIATLLILDMTELMQKPHLLLIKLIHQLVPGGSGL